MLLAILGLCGAPAAFSSAAVRYGQRFTTRTLKALGSTGGAFLTPRRPFGVLRDSHAAIGVQQPSNVACGYRRAEPKTLHFLAAEGAQHFVLLRRLDALRDRDHMARRGDIHHGLHNAGGPVGFGNIGDEAAIDLDFIEWKALQVAQRRIAGSEIVQRNPDSNGPKLVQNRKRRIVIADQDRLGDFKFQPARRKPRGRQRRDDLQRQRTASELDRRHVHRELDFFGPCHCFWSTPNRPAR
jgi:hypothetical protein